MSRVKVVFGGVSVAERAQVRGQDERGAAERAALAEAEGVEQGRDELAVRAGRADVGLQRLQRAAGVDQQVAEMTGRDEVLGERAAGREHDVGAGEPDHEAGHGLFAEVELGRLSFTERACESCGHQGVSTRSIGRTHSRV